MQKLNSEVMESRPGNKVWSSQGQFNTQQKMHFSAEGYKFSIRPGCAAIVNGKLKGESEPHRYFAVRTGAACSMTGSSTLIEGLR